MSSPCRGHSPGPYQKHLACQHRRISRSWALWNPSAKWWSWVVHCLAAQPPVERRSRRRKIVLMALPSGFPKNIIWKNIDRKNETGNGWGGTPSPLLPTLSYSFTLLDMVLP